MANNIIQKRKITNIKNIKGDITFFGGEPVLRWSEIIVPLVKYRNENYSDLINFNMTTNGTLLDEEKILFLHNNNIPILLSIDGVEEVQNYNRPCHNKNIKSFDLIEKNFPLILKYFPKTTFRSTVYQDTCNYVFENFVFASYLGFQNIFMMPDSRSGLWTQENEQELKEQLHLIFTVIKDAFKNNQLPPIIFSPMNTAFKSIINHDIYIKKHKVEDLFKPISRNVIRCGLGTGMGAIGYDGKIYGCQEQVSKNSLSKFYIGDIYSGINKDLHKELLLEYSKKVFSKCANEELCKTCKLFGTCATACPSTAYDLYNDFFTTSEIQCKWNQWLFDESLELMHELVADNNLVFKYYLDEYCHYSSYFNNKKEII